MRNVPIGSSHIPVLSPRGWGGYGTLRKCQELLPLEAMPLCHDGVSIPLKLSQSNSSVSCSREWILSQQQERCANTLFNTRWPHTGMLLRAVTELCGRHHHHLHSSSPMTKHRTKVTQGMFILAYSFRASITQVQWQEHEAGGCTTSAAMKWRAMKGDVQPTLSFFIPARAPVHRMAPPTFRLINELGQLISGWLRHLSPR